MQIKQIVLSQFATNCYIVSGALQGSCILMDPADDAKKILGLLNQLGLKPEAILLTHGHYDHILAVPGLQERWPGLLVYCHPYDCPKGLVEYDMGQKFPTVTAFSDRRELAEGQKLFLAGFDIAVLHTPGHTPGSVTFAIGDALFTGDTLFCGSIGRTDFAGGDDGQMMASLSRLAALPGNYRVYPGHENTTTLDGERRHNPYLKAVFKTPGGA